MGELDKFILKFRSLCESGSNARLVVDTEDGIAKISLHVSVKLEQAFGRVNITSSKSHRRGRDSPCKQRRRERREAERNAKVVAAQVSTGDSDGCADTSIIDTELNLMDIKFDLKVEAQEAVKNVDITEAIEVNFSGGLDEKKVSLNHPSRSILVHKMKESSFKNENDEMMFSYIYRIYVKNEVDVLSIINEWKKPNQFDDLAFRNATDGKKQVKLRDVRKLS